MATAIVFCISSAFPAVAAFVQDTESWPKWWGVLDVGIAFLIAMLAFAVIGLARGKVTKQAEDESYRAYRILIHGIFVMLAVFFLFGNRIVWSNCLTGIAWRSARPRASSRPGSRRRPTAKMMTTASANRGTWANSGPRHNVARSARPVKK